MSTNNVVKTAVGGDASEVATTKAARSSQSPVSNNRHIAHPTRVPATAEAKRTREDSAWYRPVSNAKKAALKRAPKDDRLGFKSSPIGDSHGKPPNGGLIHEFLKPRSVGNTVTRLLEGSLETPKVGSSKEARKVSFHPRGNTKCGLPRGKRRKSPFQPEFPKTFLKFKKLKKMGDF